MADGFIRFDEIEDVLSSLDLLASLTPRLKENPTLWKWTIVAAQSALQGAVVCALHDGSGLSVMDAKSARAIIRWHDNPEIGYPQRQRMADFWTLLKRYCKQRGGSERRLSRSEARDVYRLHCEFRNSFQHFAPGAWSIEAAGLPRIVGTAINLVEEAMNEHNVQYRLNAGQVERLIGALQQSRNSLA